MTERADTLTAAAKTEAILRVLTNDLRNKHWQEMYATYGDALPKTAGHCYAASEALYHMLGGKAEGWKPMYGLGHWWLQHRDGTIADPTATQFGPDQLLIIRMAGKGKGFLTKHPSKRAQTIINRVEESY